MDDGGGLHESLPLYSGGLGILAGDHIKSASDLGLPLIGVGLFLLPFQLFLLWVSVPYVLRSWRIGETSSQQGGLPALYLVKALIPLAALLLLLAGIGLALRAASRWRRAGRGQSA